MNKRQIEKMTSEMFWATIPYKRDGMSEREYEWMSDLMKYVAYLEERSEKLAEIGNIIKTFKKITGDTNDE